MNQCLYLFIIRNLITLFFPNQSIFWTKNSILSQYRFCAGGIGLGAAYAIKNSKGPLPMVAAGIAGTVGDLIYGYYQACAKEAEEYERVCGKRRT